LPLWTNVTLSLPFSRAVVTLGHPVSVPKEARGQALERFRHMLEEALESAHKMAAERL